MARVAVPIIKLNYQSKDAFSNEIIEVFEKEEVWNKEEDFTFTGRVNLNFEAPDSNTRKERVSAKLRALLPKEEADRLLALLDEHSWDVSFFVDGY